MNIEWPYSDLFECCFDIGNGFFPVFLRKYFKHQMVDRWFSPILWLCYSEYLTEYNCTSSTEISLFNFYTRQLFILQEKILYFFFLFYYCYISCSNLHGIRLFKIFRPKVRTKILLRLHLFSSIFTNLLQIQIVTVADRRVANTFSRCSYLRVPTFFFPDTFTFPCDA